MVKYLPVMVIKKLNRKMVMGSNKLMDPNFIVYLYRLDGTKQMNLNLSKFSRMTNLKGIKSHKTKGDLASVTTKS